MMETGDREGDGGWYGKFGWGNVHVEIVLLRMEIMIRDWAEWNV